MGGIQEFYSLSLLGKKVSRESTKKIHRVVNIPGDSNIFWISEKFLPIPGSLEFLVILVIFWDALDIH